MANTIKHKQSAVATKVPTTAQLQLGELGINTYDGKLYLKKNVSGTETVVDVSGSVTSLSVASANGFAGTVATATTTPAITLSTSVTGLLKGNGTAISAATVGTDYQAPITGGATTITTSNLTASRALVSDASGKVAIAATTSTELGHVSGVTSAIQTQLDGKAGTSAANTFTSNQVISTSSTSPALRITQTGTGDALVVEDSANPDSTSFIVNADGTVGIGGIESAHKLYVNGRIYTNTGFHVAVDHDIAARTESGFFETDTATTAEGWPETTNSWYHLLTSTHSNLGNYYSMQFASSFYDSNKLYYRSTNGSGTTAWNKIWHAGNDGAGSGLDADLLDGISSGSFLRSDASTTYSGGLLRVRTPAGSLGSNTSEVNTLQVIQATVGTDAFMTFHIEGDYAAHFGLDGTTNDLFYGGWSAGTNKYRICHAANLGNFTHYIGTTAIALNRASASQSLTGITSIDGSAAFVTNTNLGKTGAQGFMSTTSWTSTDWSNVPIGGCGMTVNNTPGAPNTNYGFFSKTGNRDAGGGWGGIWMDYNGPNLYFGTTTVSSTNAIWNKVWSDSNDGAGSGLDADLLDGQHGSYYATASSLSSYLPLSGGTITGSIGIGVTPSAGETLNISKNPTGDGGGLAYGMRNSGTIQSSVSAAYYGYFSNPSTQAATFTLSSLTHFAAGQATIGAGSSVLNQFGYFAFSNLVGATNNYGFYSQVPFGSGRYNFYAAGTANNFFEGPVKTNGTLAGGYLAHAAGTTAMALGADKVVKVTPNATATYTTTVAPAGATASIIIVTSGTTSYTITFGTGFLTTGTLTTGTVTAKTFVINFVSDGTTMIESSRTIAM